MSTIGLNIISAKIIAESFTKNTKGDFEYATFTICPVISKKDKNGEWQNKPISFYCMITGYALQKFMAELDQNVRNYITIINARLTDFHVESVEKMSQRGTLYSDNSYKFFNVQVQDFIITHKPFKDDGGNKNPTPITNNDIPL